MTTLRIAGGRMQLARYAAVMRIPHWSKNAFVLAPLFFSLQLRSWRSAQQSLTAFVVFCLVASTVYIFNDWTDREADARHPEKRHRPLASGEVTVREAAGLGLVLLTATVAMGIAASLPPRFWIVVAAYAGINVAYSLWLRRIVLVDVSVIASGFILRVVAGTVALEIAPSSWIILSTGLLALLLALGKRRADLAFETPETRASLDGYTREFIDVALAALAAAVIAFYALFTVSEYTQRQFHSDNLYLTTFFVVLGIIRFLQLVIAYERHGSPTEIALRDRPIQLLVAGWLATFYLLAYHGA